MLATQICVLAAYGVARRNTNLGLTVTTTINVHPHDILVSGLVVNYFRSLNHAVWTCVTRCCLRQESALIVPFDEVARGIAVDVDERRAIGLVFADPDKV